MASVNRQPATAKRPARGAGHLLSRTANPRRQPSHLSVSLVRPSAEKGSRRSTEGSSASSDSASDVSNRATLNDTPSRLALLRQKTSSGESSNAEGWFDRSNNQVHAADSSYADNDPPFFMRNSSSSQSPPDAEQQQQQQQQLAHQWQNVQNVPVHMLPHRPTLFHLGTDGNSAEEYHGVIDDLTIENQKLKRRLRKYEKLHDSHLKHERLFEIRVHGLPADKKRELEEMLKNFASNINTPNGAEFYPNGYEGLIPNLATHMPSLSQTSQQHTDSAYASMSASGQGSSMTDSKNTRFAPTAKSRHQNIQSYLHRIPQGLLPQQNPTVMSEQAKQRIVVSRLEQIFAGKGAAAGPHHQALQQQDVSQSAAHADRSAVKASGGKARNEGVREAPIMEEETEEPMDSTADNPTKLDDAVQTARLSKENIMQLDIAGAASPEHSQRPTRPLDLDPDRAQVPAENLRYIRHLGFSPLDLDSVQSPQDGHGWIYLNVLINMAQLHTLNVTADFVRKALAELSGPIEVSHDGRKVRWKGRGETSSSVGFGSIQHSTADDAEAGASPRKRVKLVHPGEAMSRSDSYQHVATSTSTNQPDSSRLKYTPLFYHRSESDDSEASSSEGEDDNMSTGFVQHMPGDSSGRTTSGIRTMTTSTRRKEKRDDGPIIFYNNARFLTDLSGDSGPPSMHNAPTYRLADMQPIGKPQVANGGKLMESRGLLDQLERLPDSVHVDEQSPDENMELEFPSSPSLAGAESGRAISPILEATGIGGVYPADHFAITVETRQRTKARRLPVSRVATAGKVHPKIARVLQSCNPQRQTAPSIDTEILQTHCAERLPSALPPALCYMPSSFSSCSTSSPASCLGPLPTAFAPPRPQSLHLASHSSSPSSPEADVDDSDNESDGSLDLLAAARALDPDGIMKREREWDANMAERLAEEIPAGSSAATVGGGGSGFCSPEMASEGHGRGAYMQRLREARGR